MALPASPLGWDLWFTPSTYSPRHMCPSDHIPLKSLPQRQRVRTNSLPRLNLAVLPLSTPPESVTQYSDSLSLMAPAGRAEGFVVPQDPSSFGGFSRRAALRPISNE